ACSSATCLQTRSSTSERSAPPSPATIEEPSFATTVIAAECRLGARSACRRLSGVEHGLELADDDLGPRPEAPPPERRDYADLPKAALQVVERLGVLEVVARDQQLDATPGHAESPVALGGHVEALVGARPVDAVLGLEFARSLRDLNVLRKRFENRRDQVVQSRARRRADPQGPDSIRAEALAPASDHPLGPVLGNQVDLR